MSDTQTPHTHRDFNREQALLAVTMDNLLGWIIDASREHIPEYLLTWTEETRREYAASRSAEGGRAVGVATPEDAEQVAAKAEGR